MSRIHVSTSHLTEAFHYHRRAAKRGDGPSSLLLKFYAVECGLKSLYLEKNGHDSTSLMRKGAFGGDGHDLSEGLRSCRAGAEEVCAEDELPAEAPTLRRCDGMEPSEIIPRSAHQAWRYGARIEPEDDRRYDAWLGRIESWLTGRL